MISSIWDLRRSSTRRCFSREILTADGRTLAQGCLAWLWARGENTVPVPGFRTEKQARDNAAALALGPLTEEQMRQIDIALDRV